MSETTSAPTSMEPSGHRTMRRILRAIAIVGLIVVLIPGYSSDGAGETTTRSIWLGLPFSPWLQFTEEHTKTETATNHSTRMGAEFLSVSFILGVIACAADWGERKLRQKRGG